MYRSFNSIRFTKVQNEINKKWYDWLSDEVSIPYLDHKKLRIHLEFNDKELDQFQKEIEITVKNMLRLNDRDRKQTKKHLFAYYKDIEYVIGEEELEDMPSLKTDEEIFNHIDLTRLSIGKSIITSHFYANFSGNCDWENVEL